MSDSDTGRKRTIKKSAGLIRRVALMDNPILRHFIKKHALSDGDALALGVILDLTDQMKTPIKTTYRAIADNAGLTAMQVYQAVQSLHRERIVEYKQSGEYVHLSFREIDESIEEIALAHRNARKIRLIEQELTLIRAKKYVPIDDLFDIMYPLMGRLVAAKIAEALRVMVNYINDRLDSAFSWRMWTYRARSFTTRVPLAEIILRESLPCYIDEIFIIEKKTSLLLGHASRSGERHIDKDLVGGMLAAINDFIKTSFKGGKSGFRELLFDDSKVIVAESLYFYAAVVVQGTPDLGFMDELQSLADAIHVLYRVPLKKFNGSMDGFAGIERPLADMITRVNDTGRQSSGGKPLMKVKIAGALALACLVVALSWMCYASWRDRAAEHEISGLLAQSLPLYSHDLDIAVDGNIVVVTGTVDSGATAAKIDAIAGAAASVERVVNRAVITDYRSVLRLRREQDELDARLMMFQLVAVRQDLEKIVIQFPAGSIAVDDAQKLQLRRVYDILAPYRAIHVDIVAFIDPTGGVEVNRKLAAGRMDAVKNYLGNMGIGHDRLHVTGFSPDILASDPRFVEFKDRRGIMLFARFHQGSDAGKDGPQ